jgi:hypothetical protein
VCDWDGARCQGRSEQHWVLGRSLIFSRCARHPPAGLVGSDAWTVLSDAELDGWEAIREVCGS